MREGGVGKILDLRENGEKGGNNMYNTIEIAEIEDLQ